MSGKESRVGGTPRKVLGIRLESQTTRKGRGFSNIQTLGWQGVLACSRTPATMLLSQDKSKGVVVTLSLHALARRWQLHWLPAVNGQKAEKGQVKKASRQQNLIASKGWARICSQYREGYMEHLARRDEEAVLVRVAQRTSSPRPAPWPSLVLVKGANVQEKRLACL